MAIDCLLMILFVVLRPLKKIQDSIRLYKDTKDGAAVAKNLSEVKSRNELSQLKDDVADLTKEMDDYIVRIEKGVSEKERIRTEMTLASRIQTAMLPNVFPPYPDRKDFEICASMTPAKQIGGDFYDFFLLKDRYLCLTIADVSGKGIPAALFMMASKITLSHHFKMGKSPAQISGREISTIAKLLGISPALFEVQRIMETLSGGERVKVQMAALLLSRCDILLLDEPSNDLDIETLEWLSGFLRSFPGSVLYISHDEVLLEETADIIIHLEQIRRKTICRSTVSRSGYRDYMNQRERQLAHQEQIARFEKADFRKKKERYLSIYQAVEHAQDSISRKDPSTGRLLKKKMHNVKSMGHRLDREEDSPLIFSSTLYFGLHI